MYELDFSHFPCVSTSITQAHKKSFFFIFIFFLGKFAVFEGIYLCVLMLYDTYSKSTLWSQNKSINTRTLEMYTLRLLL